MNLEPSQCLQCKILLISPPNLPLNLSSGFKDSIPRSSTVDRCGLGRPGFKVLVRHGNRKGWQWGTIPEAPHPPQNPYEGHREQNSKYEVKSKRKGVGVGNLHLFRTLLAGGFTVSCPSRCRFRHGPLRCLMLVDLREIPKRAAGCPRTRKGKGRVKSKTSGYVDHLLSFPGTEAK